MITVYKFGMSAVAARQLPEELREQLRGLAQGERAGLAAADALRRALVEVLAHGERPRLVEALDESLLGIRPRPAGYFAARALAS